MAANNCFVVFLTCFAAIGGFLFGYDIGVIGGVKDMDSFRTVFKIPLSADCIIDNKTAPEEKKDCKNAETTLGLIVSTFSLGCLVGALIAGFMSDQWGRKRTIIIGSTWFVIGGAIQSGAVSLWMIFLGRVMAGVGVGIMSMVVPLYNAEASPEHLRGRLVSLNQLSITVGIMVSFLVNLGCVEFEIGWRISLGIQIVFAVILLVGMIMLPESPRWLMQHGHHARAKAVLCRLRSSAGNVEVEEELEEIRETVENEKDISSTWMDLFREGMWRRTLIGVSIQLFQQFTGMNVIMYYSTSVFNMVSVSKYTATALTGVINFLSTFIGIYLVDKVGRKILLLSSSLGMALSVFAAAVILIPFHCGDDVSRSSGYAVTFFVCLFVLNFAYGWGPVAWVVTSEIFPLRIRGKAVSVTTAANWIGNFSIAMGTPLLLDCGVLGIRGTLTLMGVLLVLSFLFVLFTMPETKGKSLEHIDELFQTPSWSQISEWKRYVCCNYKCPCCQDSQDEYQVLSGHEMEGRSSAEE